MLMWHFKFNCMLASTTLVERGASAAQQASHASVQSRTSSKEKSKETSKALDCSDAFQQVETRKMQYEGQAPQTPQVKCTLVPHAQETPHTPATQNTCRSHSCHTQLKFKGVVFPDGCGVSGTGAENHANVVYIYA